MSWPLVPFTDVVQARGSGAYGLPQSEWMEKGQFPVIGQGAGSIEGWSDRKDLVLTPDSAVVLYGGHTRRAKYVDRPFVPGPNVRILSPQAGLEPKFLFHYLAQLRIESRGYADHFPEVRRSKIPLPPLSEQRRIATILDKADALRAKRREAIAKLDQLLQSVFLDMFGDPVTNPKNWPVRDLSEAADFITGHPFKSAAFLSPGEGIKLCRGTNVLPSSLDWTEEANWNREDIVRFERYRLFPGDVVVAMDRPWISSGFKIHLFSDDDPECLLVQRVARLRPSAHFKPNYLYTLFASDAFKRHCKPTETTIPHISPNDFRSFPVLDPGKSKIDHFECIASSVASHAKSLSRGLFIAERLFGSVQRKAFSDSSN